MNKYCGNQFSYPECATLGKANEARRSQPLEMTSCGPLGTDTRETAESYRGELFRLGRYRVVICRDGLQWLYRRKRGVISPRGVAWNTVGYCVSRNALMRLHRTHNGFEAQEIKALPSHIHKGAQND